MGSEVYLADAVAPDLGQKLVLSLSGEDDVVYVAVMERRVGADASGTEMAVLEAPEDGDPAAERWVRAEVPVGLEELTRVVGLLEAEAARRLRADSPVGRERREWAGAQLDAAARFRDVARERHSLSGSLKVAKWRIDDLEKMLEKERAAHAEALAEAKKPTRTRKPARRGSTPRTRRAAGGADAAAETTPAAEDTQP